MKRGLVGSVVAMLATAPVLVAVQAPAGQVISGGLGLPVDLAALMLAAYNGARLWQFLRGERGVGTRNDLEPLIRETNALVRKTNELLVSHDAWERGRAEGRDER